MVSHSCGLFSSSLFKSTSKILAATLSCDRNLSNVFPALSASFLASVNPEAVVAISAGILLNVSSTIDSIDGVWNPILSVSDSTRTPKNCAMSIADDRSGNRLLMRQLKIVEYFNSVASDKSFKVFPWLASKVSTRYQKASFRISARASAFVIFAMASSIASIAMILWDVFANVNQTCLLQFAFTYIAFCSLISIIADINMQIQIKRRAYEA